jgi:glucokinase
LDKVFFVGVDIGGTKVAAGLVNACGEISAQVRVPMISNSSAQDGLEAVLSAISKVMPGKTESIGGIGICAPGPLDPKTGTVLNPPNVPCWRNFPLAQAVQKYYRAPVKVDNDANAAALAEFRWGAARGYRYVFYATLGTGIGSGIVLDGKIYHGRTGSAGEGGHVSIDHRGPICRCGKPGCIEVLASGTAVVESAREELAAGARSSMLELAGGNAAAITGEILGKAAESGDALAHKILGEATAMLALWLSNIIDLFDPNVIVIGGGAAALYRPFLDKLRTRIPQITVNPRASEVPIVPARYGADSGIAGGAALCASGREDNAE